MTSKYETFPLFVKSSGKKVLVIGSGTIATRRIITLAKFGFQINVIGTSPTDEVLLLEAEGRIDFEDRHFNEEDLNLIDKDIFMVVAATDNRSINKIVGEKAAKVGVFHSIADAKEECDFFFPAVREKDDVVIGVAGDGRDHKKTRKIADFIGDKLKEEI